MGLAERIMLNRHKEHEKSGAVDDKCPLCAPRRLPVWRANLRAKELTNSQS